METILNFFPLLLILVYIGIPFAIIYFFYKKYEGLAKKRNEELKKQNDILERIASVLERSS
jgi:hypothetical protein